MRCPSCSGDLDVDEVREGDDRVLIAGTLRCRDCGGSDTRQSRITGASGFSDGALGAVFLPDGGIVSTGN
jgi:hypothetical protein